MRDIRTEGNLIVNGDFTVNDNSQTNYIPFEQCTVEQLQQALKHHERLASKERTRINRIAFKFLGIALFVGAFLAIWYFIAGQVQNAMFLIGLVGIGAPVALAIKTGERRSTFEQRQLNTIAHINTLLRERK